MTQTIIDKEEKDRAIRKQRFKEQLERELVEEEEANRNAIGALDPDLEAKSAFAL